MPASSSQPAVRRPFHLRGTGPALERRDGFASENLCRLAILAGIRCPMCGEKVAFDGMRLTCTNTQTCLSWSNAISAEDEIYCGIS